MKDVWHLADHTSATGGYIRLFRDKTRICDFFPFATSASEQSVRAWADKICATMNECEKP